MWVYIFIFIIIIIIILSGIVAARDKISMIKPVFICPRNENLSEP